MIKDQQQLYLLLADLLSAGQELEWLEFKASFYEPQVIGEYLSALANAACIASRREGYLVFGIDDSTMQVTGTSFKPRTKRVGNQQLELWLNQLLQPDTGFTIYEFSYESKPVVMFAVQAARGKPVSFKGKSFVRVNSSKTSLSNYPELEKRIWLARATDWTAERPPGATLADLDPSALCKAREEYKAKHQHRPLHVEVDDWSDEVFLSKIGLAVGGELTHAAIMLLGKSEAVHFLRPSVARMTWIVKDRDGLELDYRHFDPPFILAVDDLLEKIRNLNIRVMPDGTLFPVEISQYDSWVMREALHNCIAHQDYGLCSRITVVETPESIVFANAGRFLPGSVENVLHQDAPSAFYPNRLLTDAMVNLNMIDTIGSGIRRMFASQRKRYMPMPDYDLRNPDEVLVRLDGRVLDEGYSKLLIKRTDLSLDDVILLDRIQRGRRITKDEHRRLKPRGLVEGRYPKLHIAAELAQAAGRKVDYTRNRAFNDQYYKDMILNFIDQHGSGKPGEIQNLLMDKLSDLLDEHQRKNKVRNLLQDLSRRGLIRNTGGRGAGAIWKRVS